MTRNDTWNIHAVAAFVSLSGIFFGLDTGAIGPITVMPQFLDTFGKFRNHAIQGALVATILFSASTASFFAGALSDKISRRRTIMVGALTAAIGSAIEASSVKLWMLVVGRLVAGAGEGLFLGPCGVYLIEISPANVRGKITTMLQLFITIGIASGYFISYGTVKLSNSFSWRTPFIVQSVVAFTLAAGMERLPYSPRWLLLVGRNEEAFAVMEQFDRSGVEREKAELLARQESETSDATLRETFRDSTTRWRTILAIFLMGMQQLSGIDAVLYFAPLIFQQAGLNSRNASFLASGITGIVLVVVTIPAQLYLMDRWGRRPSIIWGGVSMGLCMLIIGSLYASGGSKTTAGKWTIISMIYIFTIAFSITWAVVLKLFIIEVQPNRTRAIASTLSHSSNWIDHTSYSQLAFFSPALFAFSMSPKPWVAVSTTSTKSGTNVKKRPAICWQKCKRKLSGQSRKAQPSVLKRLDWSVLRAPRQLTEQACHLFKTNRPSRGHRGQ